MQAQLVILVADKYGSVGRQLASKSTGHSQLHESRAELLRIPRMRLKIESELPPIAIESEKSL
jgi:hypothetical protein